MIRTTRLLRMFFGPVSLLILTGCMTPRVDQSSAEESYKRAVSCCKTFGDAYIDTLPENLQTDITIDGHSQAYLFPDSGISFFHLIKLPRKNSIQELRIRSHIYSGNNAIHIFYPVVSFLDDQFNAIKSVDPATFQYVSLCTPGQRGMNEEPSEEVTSKIDTRNVRYVLIYTTPDLIKNGKKYEGDCPVILARSGPIFVPVAGGKTEISFPGSPVTSPGGITLTLSDAVDAK